MAQLLSHFIFWKGQHGGTWQPRLQNKVPGDAGRVVNIANLGSRVKLEESVQQVQRSCLAEMFQVSMDRQNYAAVGEHSAAKGEEMALEEIRALEEGPPVRMHPACSPPNGVGSTWDIGNMKSCKNSSVARK